MIIKRKRIRNIKNYIGFIKPSTKIVIGVIDIVRYRDILTKIGFTDNLEIGESMLPSTSPGPVSEFNAEGRYKRHRDQPMETAYRTREWHWKEWRGRYDYEDKWDFVDVPYQRYPRTFISPPSIELKIAANTQGEKIITSPLIDYIEGNETLLKHIINLFLEILGECQVFTEDLDAIIRTPIKRLNWRILPPGKRPWKTLRKEIDPIIDLAPKGNQPVIRYRLEIINRYEPNFVAIGQAGFHGYIGFGFDEKNIYVFESIYTGNATYVFDERWEELSKKTKAEILDQNLQNDRIIHRKGWAGKIKNLLGE